MLALNSAFPVQAQKELYGTLIVEYSDAAGKEESLNVLVSDGYLYADATQLGQRMGYEVAEVNDGVVIMNRNGNGKLPYSFTQFSYSTKKVVHLVYMDLTDCYQAPCVSIKNEKGIWIPLEFSLLMMNSSLLTMEETVLIEMPEKTIVDILLEISLNCGEISFDFGNDFGYTESDILWQESASRIINQFNGLLKQDETAWASAFAWAVAPELGYDAKYGEDFATLMCTNSGDELSEAIKKIEEVNDYLAEDGKLGVFLEKIDKRLDNDLGNWEEVCDTLLEGVEDGTGRVSTFNRAYHKLEKAFNRQSSFVHTAGTIQRVQKGFSEATKGFSKLVEVGRLVNYGTEFGNQDRYSMAALKKYTAKFADKTIVPREMMNGIGEYLSLLESDVVTFSTSQYIKENWMDLVSSALDLGTVLKQQATWQLIVWDLTSEYVPFIKNGLSAADKFELSLYGFVFQADALTNYLELSNIVFQTEGNITAENIYELTQIGYVYLKSSYITRNAAVASLRAKSDSIYKQIQPLIDRENRINEKIGGYMAELKTAEKTNKGCIYGFLPADNVEYLEIHSDERLIEYVSYKENEIPSSIIGTWVVDGKRTNSGNSESLRYMFGSSIKYGAEMKINEDGTFFWAIAAGWGGDGTYVVDENNIICNYIQDGYEECFEMRLLKENDKEYFVMDMTNLLYESNFNYYLYWIRNVDSNISEYKFDYLGTYFYCGYYDELDKIFYSEPDLDSQIQIEDKITGIYPVDAQGIRIELDESQILYRNNRVYIKKNDHWDMYVRLSSVDYDFKYKDLIDKTYTYNDQEFLYEIYFENLNGVIIAWLTEWRSDGSGASLSEYQVIVENNREQYFEIKEFRSRENYTVSIIPDGDTVYVHAKRENDGWTSVEADFQLVKDEGENIDAPNHADASKPDGVRWKNARAEWNLKRGSQGYEMEIYKDREFFRGSKYIGVSRENMGKSLCPYINESGDYRFRVRVLDDQGNAISEWSEWSDSFQYIRPNQELGTVSNVRWSAEKGIEWDPPTEIPSMYQNRIRYNLVIYKKGKKIKIYTNLAEPILSVEEWRGDDGNYEISIQAISEDIILTANGKTIMSDVQVK